MKELISKEYNVRRLLNPKFKYVNAAKTDIAETFRIAKELIKLQNRRIL